MQICNDLASVAAATVMPECPMGSACPDPGCPDAGVSGGTIVDGTYVATKVELQLSACSMFVERQMTMVLRISGATLDVHQAGTVPGLTSGSLSFQADAGRLTMQWTCPTGQVPADVSSEYIATPTALYLSNVPGGNGPAWFALQQP